MGNKKLLSYQYEGYWTDIGNIDSFFEANIGLRLLDADGKEVVRGHAEATSDWMTPNPVPFKGTITFTAPATATGFIEVEKDNPSDKRELDASVRIPIRFK